MNVQRNSEAIVSLQLAKWIKALSNKTEFAIPTFSKRLDSLLGGGGVECGYVTEIFGTKGMGKTTLCYQLCINVQLPRSLQGLQAEAVFIDTENSCSSARFKEMARACAEHCTNILTTQERRERPQVTSESLQKGVHIIPCGSLKSLRAIVLELEDYIAQHNKIKLVVIDSLSYLYYTDNPLTGSGSGKPMSLYFFAQEWYRLINKYRIAIVVTNNMTSRFDEDGEKYEIPFLGDTWAPIPHIRLELSNVENKYEAKLCKTYGKIPEVCSTYYHISADGFR